MGGSFTSFNTALSALRYNRVAMDTASQNIANVDTDGYTRRRVESATAGTATRPAMWSRDQDTGSGVKLTGLARMNDDFLDARARAEHGKQSYLDVRQGILDRLETGIGEPGPDGVAAVMADFRRSWSDLANNPSTAAARSQVLARGGALADAIQLQARNFGIEAADQRAKLLVLADEVTVVASDLAATNRAVAVANLDGSDAGNLLDQRDMLALRLSELTGGKATVNETGGFDFTVNGVALVTNHESRTFKVASGVAADGSADGSPITFAVFDVDAPAVAIPVASPAYGDIGAVTEMLDRTIPGYLDQLDSVAVQVRDLFNAQHRLGFDPSGAPGEDFFTLDPADPSGSLRVAITDISKLAASRAPGEPTDGNNADALSALTGPESAYQQLVNGFGSTVASGMRLSASQAMLTQQVDGSREQLAGVNLDEEMLAMVQYQRAYEAAARVLNTADAMLDTLINRTGLLR